MTVTEKTISVALSWRITSPATVGSPIRIALGSQIRRRIILADMPTAQAASSSPLGTASHVTSTDLFRG